MVFPKSWKIGFADWSVSRKLALISFFALLGCVGTALLSLYEQRLMLREQKQAMVRNVVDAASGVLAHYEAQVRSGQLGEEAARAAAVAQIKQLRYGDNDYLWINDLHPSMVMHPFKPELDGTDISGTADPDGVHLFVEAVKLVRAQGAGYVHYRWPKPGAQQPVPKISYVRGFEPWGWVLGSGVYVDDIDRAFWSSARTLVPLALLVSAAMGLLCWAVGRRIVRPLQRAAGVADAIAEGRFDNAIEASTRDETGRLLQSMQRMQQQLVAFSAAQLELGRRHDAGETSHRIDARHFDGAYAEMAATVNHVAASHLQVQARMAEVIAAYASGDFRDDMDRLPGEKARVTEAMGGVKRNLAGIERQIAVLAAAAAAGDFSQRGDAAQYQHSFRDIVVSLNRLMEAADNGLADVARVLDGLAQADLSVRASDGHAGTFGRLAADANRTAERLAQIVERIRSGSDTIASASKQIAAGNSELSSRTEHQAASLEESASSMEQLTATVKQNADNARQANQLAIGAARVAEQGGQVVAEVVQTMTAIAESSSRIGQIIGTIDGIAFQTNILALNAAVEAARAGEQGRGFAVVAAEVRSLAQRSAAAAREIKQLIGDSSEKVDAGSLLVGQAGRTMSEIVTGVKRVTDIMAEITAASAEQGAGIDQVNRAVMQLDEVTQQNAALVEEASAAAHSLQEQADALAAEVAVFRLAAAPAAASRPRLMLAGGAR